MANEGPKIKECTHAGYLVIIEQEVIDLAIAPKILEPNARPTIRTIARTKVVQCFRCEQFFTLAPSAEKLGEKMMADAAHPLKEN